MVSTEIIISGIVGGLLVGGVYALVGIGLTLIFGVMDIVNFAHGEYLMLGMYAAFFMNAIFGVSPYLLVLIIAPAFPLVGFATERLVISPVREENPITQFIATLGVLIILQNGAQVAFSADSRVISHEFAIMSVGPVNFSTAKLIAFVLAIVLTLLVWLFLRYTETGRNMRATEQNREAARLAGIDVERMDMLAFGIGIALVAAAGAIIVPVFAVYPTVGTEFVLIAFAVVVLGGLGSVVGATLGGLLIGVVEQMTAVFLEPTLSSAVIFLVFILVLVLKPSGLMGRAE